MGCRELKYNCTGKGPSPSIIQFPVKYSNDAPAWLQIILFCIGISTRNQITTYTYDHIASTGEGPSPSYDDDGNMLTATLGTLSSSSAYSFTYNTYKAPEKGKRSVRDNYDSIEKTSSQKYSLAPNLSSGLVYYNYRYYTNAIKFL